MESLMHLSVGMHNPEGRRGFPPEHPVESEFYKE